MTISGGPDVSCSCAPCRDEAIKRGLVALGTRSVPPYPWRGMVWHRIAVDQIARAARRRRLTKIAFWLAAVTGFCTTYLIARFLLT